MAEKTTPASAPDTTGDSSPPASHTNPTKTERSQAVHDAAKEAEQAVADAVAGVAAVVRGSKKKQS